MGLMLLAILVLMLQPSSILSDPVATTKTASGVSQSTPSTSTRISSVPTTVTSINSTYITASGSGAYTRASHKPWHSQNSTNVNGTGPTASGYAHHTRYHPSGSGAYTTASHRPWHSQNSTTVTGTGPTASGYAHHTTYHPSGSGAYTRASQRPWHSQNSTTVTGTGPTASGYAHHSGYHPSGVLPSGVSISGLSTNKPYPSGYNASSHSNRTQLPHNGSMTSIRHNHTASLTSSQSSASDLPSANSSSTSTTASVTSTTSSTKAASASDVSGGSSGTNNPWNPTNATCSGMNNLNASQMWSYVNGDSVVQSFSSMYAGNKLMCSDCYGMDKVACTSKDPTCQNGLQDLAKPPGSPGSRWDTGAAKFAQDVDIGDLNCDIGVSECSGAPSCASCNGPGAFALLKSIETMHNVLQSAWDAIETAGNAAGHQMTQFQTVFAPVPSIKDEAIMLGVLIGIVGGLLGALSGPAGILAAVCVGVGSSVAMDLFFFGQPPTPDTNTILGQIITQMQGAYSTVANSLFTTGQYHWTSKDGKKSSSISMETQMQGGALIAAPADINDTFTGMVPQFQKVLFQQLALVTWEHLEADGVTHVPYITFYNQPCDQMPKGKTVDSSITYKGKCYYLLDGKPGVTSYTAGYQGQPIPNMGCTGGSALPGGTNKELTQNGDNFAQLSLADFIVPSVEGWIQNHNQNGYDKASAGGQLVQSTQTAGAVNIPICDYIGNPSNPGVGCPILGDFKLTDGGKGCLVVPPSAGKNQPGDWHPGRCNVHIDQWQKNEGYDNPLNNYQILANISDASGIEIGQAAKQSAAESLEVVDSVLPFDLVVSTGATDDAPIQFWYSDQYWDSTSSQCSVGAYDHGMRQMDCGFQCPEPAGEPPASATIAHPYPNAPTAAVGGDVSFTNTFNIASATPSPTSTGPPPPPPKPTYATGSCGLHVIQFQKNEGSENPTGDYEIEATLYDGKQQPIGSSGHVPAPDGKPVSVTGLVSPFTITAGPVDSSPLTMNFNGVSFDSGSSQCKVGAYDSGNRNMDCGFTC